MNRPMIHIIDIIEVKATAMWRLVKFYFTSDATIAKLSLFSTSIIAQ